jgi:hypothetical protein
LKDGSIAFSKVPELPTCQFYNFVTWTTNHLEIEKVLITTK